MDISYLGHSSFKMKGKTAVLITDPYGEKCGKFPKKDVEADIVTVSHDHFDHNAVALVGNVPFVISGPGEYEIKGVSVIGVPTWHDNKNGAERGANTVYVIEMDGLRICHAGDLGHKLNEAQLEEIGQVDIAMIPVGGTYTLDAKTAAEAAKQLDPWLIIPMHYRQEELDKELMEQLAPVDGFLKEMGADVAPIAKLIVSRDKLPQETQVVVLERK